MRDGSTRGPGRPRQPIPRRRFLEAARARFAAAGYEGASMGAIARAAGVSKSALFHHFPSKEALYVEVLTGITDDLGQLILDAFGEGRDFLTRLDLLGEAIVRYLGRRPVAARLLMREVVDGGPFLRGPGQARVQGSLEATTALLEAGMAEGTIPRRDPRQLAGSIIGLHLLWFSAGGVSGHLLGADPFAPEAVEQRVREVKQHVRSLCGAPVR